MDTQKKVAWLERVEDIINILEGSSVSELELIEGGTEITIRRSPGMVLTPVLVQSGEAVKEGLPGGAGRAVDKSIPIIAPLTGVYYSAASPTSPPFVNIGDVVQMGQVIALIEAMKVFNEVSAEVAGRVVALVASNGDVVQKGDVLLRVEPV
jgi:biotin carboxyl carrier protein